MLSLYPVLAPHARAKILQVDYAAATTVQGYVTVITAADVPGENDSSINHDEVLLPTSEVSHWGQAVLWVVAETEAAAKLAATKVVVQYESLEPILTVQAAITQQSFIGPTPVMRRGDPQTALKSAEHCLSGEVEMNGQDHFYLETQTSWVFPMGKVTIKSIHRPNIPQKPSR